MDALATTDERAHPNVLEGLGVTGALYRTLRSTNAIENLSGLVGRFVRNVRR